MKAAVLGMLAALACLASDVVWTRSGFVRGRTSAGVESFLGIPYAAPPVGDLRWKAPAAAASWDGVRDAAQFGPRCVQPALDGGEAIEGSEDCLYLNLYRPAGARVRDLRPVLVYIHGGSNQRGSGEEYDPSAMVANAGIVAVTINYRLNVFGFLAHASLDAEDSAVGSGNYGLQDQQAALKWVRANILLFGGDPRNVTIAGESAGGMDSCAHLVSPASAGLFHKAILQSMYCPSSSHEQALAASEPVVETLGCADAPCLRARAATDVLTAAQPLSFAPGAADGFSANPNYGGRLLPMEPGEALRTGNWNWAPILIGSNHDEMAFFLPAMLAAAKVELPLSVEAYRVLARGIFGSFAPSVLAEYPLERYSTPFRTLASELTDYLPLGCPVSGLADTFVGLAPTFRYEFNDPAAPGGRAGINMGAYHGAELQYLFDMARLPGPQTDAQRRLSEQMMRYWTNFVATGDPNGEGLPHWPRYDPVSRRMLSLQPGGPVVIDNFDQDHHCSFWATAPGPPFR